MNPALIWQENCPAAPDSALYRLATQQSLTQALRATGAAFDVDLRYLGVADVPACLQDCLPDTQAFIREVDLRLNGTAVVRAYSACAIGSAWQAVLHCGSRPLGEILFGDKNCQWTRSPMQYSIALSGSVLARRSWFGNPNGEILYLAECFLAEMADFV